MKIITDTVKNIYKSIYAFTINSASNGFFNLLAVISMIIFWNIIYSSIKLIIKYIAKKEPESV